MTYQNHISRMQRTKKRFFFLFLRHGVDEEYIQEEKEFSHMNVSLIHPIWTLNPPIGLWMNSSQILDCCMSLESLKVVPASNRVKEVSYGIRTISWLFVGWMRGMLVCNNTLSLSPTYSTYGRKAQAQVWRNIQTSYWVVDWFDVILHGAFQIFKKQDLMMWLYRCVVALSLPVKELLSFVQEMQAN